MQETWVPPLGWKDPLEEEMATHSRSFAWEIPWTEEPSRLQSMRSQRVGHDLATKQQHSLSGNDSLIFYHFCFEVHGVEMLAINKDLTEEFGIWSGSLGRYATVIPWV